MSGWEEREAIRKTIVDWLGPQRMSLHMAKDIDHMVTGVIAYEAARAALSGSTAPLDPRLIAKALFKGNIGCEGHGNRTRHLTTDHREDAEFIARELSADASPDPAQPDRAAGEDAG